MTIKLPILIFLLLPCHLLFAQAVHKDQLEYGYKGKVKTVSRQDYRMETDVDGHVRVDTIMPLVSYKYYFNQAGNMDSLTAASMAGNGQVSYYKNVYQFQNNRKTAWTSYSKTNQVLLQAQVTWTSGKEYIEKVTDAEGKPKFETTVTLNDSFRVQRTRVRAYDPAGKLIQDNTQTFQLDHRQQILSFNTLDRVNGITGQTAYQYVTFDSNGNPQRIITTKQERDVQKMVKLEYTYYDTPLP